MPEQILKDIASIFEDVKIQLDDYAAPAMVSSTEPQSGEGSPLDGGVFNVFVVFVRKNYKVKN
jgi:hypothetical protein